MSENGRGNHSGYNQSLREIFAEAWSGTNGAKLDILLAAFIVMIVSSAGVFAGYSLRFLLGEWGRNLYIVYACQYAFEILTYPLLAGVIMIGVRRVQGREIDLKYVFHFHSLPVVLLSGVFILLSYACFALLLSTGTDHFIARLIDFPLLPLFAMAVPLVVEKEMNAAGALIEATRIFRRNLPLVALTCISLAGISIVGSMTLIGLIWTIPFVTLTNGILYRNLSDRLHPAGDYPASDVGKPSTLPLPSSNKEKSVIKGGRTENVLAAVMIVLIIVAAALRLYAMYEQRSIHPPDHVSSNGINVGALFNNIIYVLSLDGKLQRRIDLTDFGINRKPADFEILMDGSLLIGDMDTGSILRCNIDNLSCSKTGPPAGLQIADNFKFAADEKRGLIVVADTNNHRIFVQNMEGSEGHVIKSSVNINYPNDLSFDQDGDLWASNTLHEYIMKIEFKDEATVETESRIETDPSLRQVAGETGIFDGIDKLKAIDGLKKLSENMLHALDKQESINDTLLHRRPLAMAWGPEGNVWITASDPYITTAGILVMSPDGMRIRHITPGKEAVPEDIVWTGKNMLVADSGLFRFYTVDVTDYSIGLFGDDEFRQEISKAEEVYKNFQIMKTVAGYNIVALALGVIVLVAVVRMKNRNGDSKPGDGKSASGRPGSSTHQGDTAVRNA